MILETELIILSCEQCGREVDVDRAAYQGGMCDSCTHDALLEANDAWEQFEARLAND